MSRFSAWSLLAVFGIGVFLSGLELMITATALPSILRDLATTDQLGKPAFSELRHASWIVNGYLLAYIVTMPLAGRLADVWGARKLFLSALLVFVAGSLVAGRAQTMDELILGRVVQGIGGGVLVPVGTAAASHLFEGDDRPRALGIIGALTFLGMAAGPFLGAAILGGLDVEGGLLRLGIAAHTPLADALAPAWRWVFYLNVPIGIVALLIGWAASSGWESPRRHVGVDVVGAIVWSVGLAAGLGAVTLIGVGDVGGPDPVLVGAALAALSIVAILATIVRGLRRPDPFLDPRLFRSVSFSSAALVSLLTGFAFATAIIGGAVFVDRVLYGGPDDQRLALGALAAATAVGALVSGFAVRVLSLRLVTLVGLVLSAAMLFLMSRWSMETAIGAIALALGLFGLGFGLTVTPRSTAAVESAGRASFGMASAIVTVARMIGMAIGVSILTAAGSTRINQLYDQLFAADPNGWRTVVPVELRDRDLRDGLVVEALEAWAAGEAARILVGFFLVAGVVTVVAIPPGSPWAGGRVDSPPGGRRATRPRVQREASPDPMAGTSSEPRSRSDDDGAMPVGRMGRSARPGPAGGDGPAQNHRATSDELAAQEPGGVRILACNDGKVAKSGDVSEIADLLKPEGARLWIDLASPSEDEIRIVADALGLHPLIAEDIAERNQRSKVETFDEDVVHVVLFVLEYSGEATASEVDFVLGPRYLLSVHDGSIGRATTAALRFGPERALQKGPDYLLYALSDTIVDGYFPVLDRLGDDIDELQDTVIGGASASTLQRLFGLKRELAALRRATSPAREIFAQLTNREIPAIAPEHVVYFRDVYDHLIRVTDELDNDRDLVAGTLDIYVSIVNNDLSRIMKRLTGVTVILAGIGAVAGIFGMSEAGNAFRGQEAGGFWLVTGFVVLIAMAAAWVLHRIDWI